MKEREEILNEITSVCENCKSHENCQEEECVLYRIEEIVVGGIIELRDILTEEEREYLSAVIRPFKIEGIVKRQSDIDEYICIYVIEKYYTYVLLLPYFKKGTMYKGMKLNKEYTLEDLGL